MALALLGTLAACDDAVIVAGAALDVSPIEIDFGKVPTGEMRAVELRLSNPSPSGRLVIDEVRIAAGSAPVFSLGPAPGELPPQGEAILTVFYAPDDAEPDAGHVELLSNALGASLIRVPIRSARTTPRIGVDPSELDLGQVASGVGTRGTILVKSLGDATLNVKRIALRTQGFAGEPCVDDGDCREGRCTVSSSGPICALACDGNSACPARYSCTTGADGYRGCREQDGVRPPLAVRGFSVTGANVDDASSLLPGAALSLDVRYTPSADDRGSAQLVLESNDPERPVVYVPLVGRPENLPPEARAALDGPAPMPIVPGTRVAVTGEGSSDPEGGALTWRWRFLVRPEDSRAAFEDREAERTAFTVDRPGDYVVGLEVRDPGGLTSTNDARVPVEASAGRRVRVELSWDRPGSDLDLHAVAPGTSVGSLGDCFFDNPSPDWPPAGPSGDPIFSAADATETIAVQDAGDGVYTLSVRVVAPSPEGPTGATLRVFLEDTLVATWAATLPVSAEAWDVATLSWPSGRLTTLDSIR